MRAFIRRVLSKDSSCKCDGPIVPALRAQLLRDLQEGVKILLAVTFTLYQNPIVVEIGQQISLIEFEPCNSTFGHMIAEELRFFVKFTRVQPYGKSRINLNSFMIDEDQLFA